MTKAADNIRILAAAMVEKAKSGHPGGSMSGADFVQVLYSEFLIHDPENPCWEARDRFFLDPGHMSPMLYAQLCMTGYFTMDELKQLRQWGSVTPGHPERNVERGIENTSGPLGQGHTFAVGAAIAAKWFNARYGEIHNPTIYAFISDGGIQEEISQGAGRMAGHLKLDNLIMHQIHTHGNTTLVFLYDSSTDVAKQVKDIQDIPAIVCERIITAFKEFQQGEMPDKYKTLNTCLLEYMNVIEAQSDVRDERISEAIRYIRKNLSGKLLCQEVADAVCLSQSRFSHLFRAQVGMTFASYVIYQRILHVYAAIFAGKSITEATIEAGFSSSSHFADVHRRVFGLPITNVTRECSFTKV